MPLLLILGAGFAVIPSAGAVDLICDISEGDIGLGLLNFDVIVVSESGNPDSRLSSSIAQISCTPEEYEALFPEVSAPGGIVGTSDTSASFAEVIATDPNQRMEFEDAVANGDFVDFVGDPIGFKTSLVSVCLAEDCSQAESPCLESSCPESDCNSNCDLLIECAPGCLLDAATNCSGTDCIQAICEELEESIAPSPCQCESVTDCVPPPGCDPLGLTCPSAAGGSSADLTVTIVFPHPDHPNSPGGRCNWLITAYGLGSIPLHFGGRDVDIVCYHSLSSVTWWNPPTTVDVNALHSDCVDHVDNAYGGALTGQDDKVLCWVHTASQNGVASAADDVALAAEVNYVNHPNGPLALHEVLHTMGAEHFPVENPSRHWKNFVCTHYHQHWWGWHPHIHYSVLNYCWMMAGALYIDSENRDRVESDMGW